MKCFKIKIEIWNLKAITTYFLKNRKLNTINIIVNKHYMLAKIADNTRTDKNTLHSYLSLYDKLLSEMQHTAHRVLEIGIQRGGSIKLWNDYFINSEIHALDIMDRSKVWEELFTKERIVLHTNINAYDNDFVYRNFYEKNLKFDFLIDDGPHTIESMIDFIKLYTPLMSKEGILIIEDVQSLEWVEILKRATPLENKKYIQVYDLRKNKNRYDDILFVINKTKSARKTLLKQKISEISKSLNTNNR